ncbi:MAG TPA: YciI family protein [Gemmatimonadaceae bacterium]|nr:YciI family protein [Gemmatimonadaceae bacterium]
MKYMLMMHVPAGKADYEIVREWTPEAFKAHIDFMHRLNRELTEAGELVGAEGLAMPGEAKLVRAGKNGMPVTDGPFPESKEFLAGYWIVEVDRPERAYEIAAKASAAPGPTGDPLNMPIEVRQVMSAPATDYRDV